MNFLIDLATLELSALTALALLAWIYLTWMRAGFWKADIWLKPEPSTPDPVNSSVAVVIPARDEADTIATTLASLTSQSFSGTLKIVVVDDQSSDGTGGIARAASTEKIAIEVINGTDLPEGWSGKVWAMSQGVEAACAGSELPDYILLTDADIEYAPHVLDKMVRTADAHSYTFVSLMARLDARGLWGQLLVPAFIYFFQLIYPFAKANTRYDSLAAAAGGCFLVRRDALEAAGGLASIKSDIIDDCALAKALKRARPAQDTLTALTHEVHSRRDNRTMESIWNMVARTAFTQLRYSWLMLAGALIGLVLTFLVPVWGLLSWIFGDAGGTVGAISLATLALMARTYWPTVRMYGLSPLWALSLPAAAIIYAGATAASAIRHARGSGARWKGRSYPAT
ncbi:Glycosyl transferase/GT2 [Candidatus Phaeomarinobacter ectocarpi]|uniref:Glycosyl transferase/GT2 n=1 Tax=Candidatus Phaeomarinibacter ectocarpi TaxID=1458461 RepID=X5MDB7_9HYPH|nr:glycosyltransferase [Candidatus Phaeomarinobacter ectocarpi]CDO58319.1 Glycosyl transferase/GT2 [Candidatus Phaeomarinobacter ectocarpi]